MSDNFEQDALQAELQTQIENQAPEASRELADQADFTQIIEKPDNDGNVQRYGYKRSDGSVMQLSAEQRQQIDKNLEEYRDRWRVKNAIVSMFEDARGNPQNLGQSMDIFFGAIKGALFDAPAEVVKTIMPDDIDAYVDKYQGLLPDAKSASGQFSQVGAQALAPTGVFNKALKGLGLANGLLRYTASGIATDFSAFDPDDANLGDIARDIGVLDNGVAEAIRSTIADSLAKNEDDGEFVKRMKNAGGGLLTQAAFDGIATSYRALRKISSQVDLQPLFDSLKKSAQSEKRFALAEQAGKVDLDAAGNKLVLPDEKSAAAADEILQGARNSTAQVVDEVVDGHQVISFFDEKAPEDAFVRTKNGDVAHGYVTQELADTLGTGTAGEIRVYNSLNKHIDSVRAKAITEHGYNDLVDFVDDTVENWNKIYKGKDGSFLIVKESDKDNIVAVRLEKERGYYKTSTVILSRNTFFKNKKPLAERAPTNQLLAKSPGAVSGTSGINNMTSNAENVKPQPTKDLLQDYDFNLKNLGTSEEMNNIISTISRQYYDDITKATIGTTTVKDRIIPNAVIDDLSTRLAVDKGRVEKLVEKFPADVEDLSIKATAMRKLLVDTTSETERMAKELANIPQEQITDEMVFKFREQITRQAAVQRKLKGAQTEIARALQSFKIAANATGAERSNAILEITQGMGGADTAVQIARRINQMPKDGLAKYIEKVSWARTTKDVFFEYWINALLSGPKTHFRNILGNEGFKLLQPVERVAAAGVGKVRKTIFKNTSQEQVRLGEFNEMLAGYFEAMPDALKMAWRAVKSEDFSSSALTKIESQQMKAITPERFGIDEASVLGRAIDYIGQGVRFPGRLLKAEDEFSRATAQNMELRAQSFREYKNALENGASEKESKAIYEETLAGRNDAVNNSVKEFQDMMTFVTPLGETGQAVQKLTQKSALAKIIMPFTRTPTNIFKEFVRRTPAAPLMREVREQIARGGIEADMAISRIATGSVLLGWAGYLVANDVLTGAGPEGALRKQWLENYQPYSIRIGDKWYSYQGLEPVSSLFGIAADASDFIKYNDAEEENESVAVNAVFAIIKNLGEKTYMQGLANFAAAWENPQQFGTYYMQSMAGSLVPAAVRDIRRVNDPYYRNISKDKVEDNQFSPYLKAIKDRTPGFSDSQPPRRNFWGEPLRAYEGSWINAVNPFNPKDVKYSPIDEELLRLDFPLNMPRKEIMGTKISNQEYDDLVVRYNNIYADGMNLRERLNYTIVTSGYLTFEYDD